jgi:phosphoglycerate dehydrogenase-like enzyme
MTSRRRITFLDDDHVIRIARLAMSDISPHDRGWLTDFFSPEAFDMDSLQRAAFGVREADDCEIRLASETEPAVRSRILVFRRGRVDRALFDRNPNLQLVQRLGGATDGIDLTCAAERGVHVSCLPRRTLAYTAEHAILLMLALRKRLVAANSGVRSGLAELAGVRPVENIAYNWLGLADVRGLNGATVGIIGLGEVGRHVARLARAFGADVVYSARRPVPIEHASELGIRLLPLNELLAISDVVSLHAANTAENINMIGSDQISAMRSHAFFVNTSRGRLVDEDALYDALLHRRIAGAGLDVHRIEPRPTVDRFCTMQNVILTPHLAGGSRLGILDELQLIFENCRAVLTGEAPLHGIMPRSEMTA